MQRHGVRFRPRCGRVRIISWSSGESAANGILFNVANSASKLVCGENLTFVETTHPHFTLTFKTEGKATFDVLHRFFKRNVRNGRDDGVEMVRHNNEGVEEESSLTVVVENGVLQQFGIGGDLKDSAPLSCDSSDEIHPRFLWCEAHSGSINEEPRLKSLQ